MFALAVAEILSVSTGLPVTAADVETPKKRPVSIEVPAPPFVGVPLAYLKDANSFVPFARASTAIEAETTPALAVAWAPVIAEEIVVVAELVDTSTNSFPFRLDQFREFRVALTVAIVSPALGDPTEIDGATLPVP